jgi:hypothetical protein
MQPTTSTTLSRVFERIAEELDIPDSLHEDAVVQYEDVASWLSAEDSPLAVYSPSVYPQGSFRLGTVVRPITEDDHYDIDLVCQLVIAKENTSQAELKTLLGDRLKERPDLKKVLEESRRCWRLNLAEHFHMDTLPCLPNPERQPNGILLTDTDLVRWQKSNPIAYANWFRDRMRIAFEQKRLERAMAANADVEAVPEWSVKTPLQRIVQLLKRHRDVYFAKDPDNRPVSIIITTLAARAYNNELDLLKGLTSVVSGMPKHITYKEGRYYVLNPVEPEENFADRWSEFPARRAAFFEWLKRAQRDLGTLEGVLPQAAIGSLAPVLGQRAVNTTAKSLGFPVNPSVYLPTLQTPNTPALAPTSHAQVPKWPEVLTQKVRVRGGVYLLNRRKKLWDLSDRALPKSVSLKFTADTQVKAPFDVHWQVVNSGKEAEADDGLRGGFYHETGTSRWETTRYAGTHWVEAFVVKDGVCLARSGKVFIRIRG